MIKSLQSITLASALALTSQAALPPAPEILPADTLAVITVPDWETAVASLQSSAAGRLWADPAMRPFRENLERKLREKFIQDAERNLGISIDDYLALLKGQLTLAVTQDDWTGSEGSEPGWILILDTGDQEAALRDRLEEVRRKLNAADTPPRPERIRDKEFSRVTIDFSDDEDAEDVELFFGQDGATLLVANSARPIEKVLARIARSGPAPLGDDPAFRQGYNAWFRDSHAYGWLNTRPIVQGFTRALGSFMPDEDALPFEPRTAIRALGLEGLQNALFALRNGADGSHANFSLAVPESDRTGLFKLVQTQPSDAAPPAFVPADAIAFMRWRLDGTAAWRALEETVRNISPEIFGFMQMVTSMAGKDTNPATDFNTAVVENLGDDLISYSKAPAGNRPEDALQIPTLTLIGARNPDELFTGMYSLTSFLPFGGDAPESRDFNGRRIRGIPIPSLDGSASRIEFAGAAGYLAISGTPGLLEEFLRSSDDSPRALRDDPALRAAAQKVDGFGTGLFGYQNQRIGSRAQWELLRKGGLDQLAGGIDPDWKELLDFTLLPEFDRVARHFGISVYTGTLDSQGLHLRVFAPTPQ